MFPYIIFWKEELCFFVLEIKTMRTYVSRKRSSKDSGENYKVTYKHTNNNVVPCLLLPLCQVERKQTLKGGEGGWR